MTTMTTDSPSQQLEQLEDELTQSERKVEQRKKRIATLKKFLGETDAAKKKYADAFDQIKKKVAAANEYFVIQSPHVDCCNSASFKAEVDACEAKIAAAKATVTSNQTAADDAGKALDASKAAHSIAENDLTKLNGYVETLNADLKQLDTLEGEIETAEAEKQYGHMWFMLKKEYQDILKGCVPLSKNGGSDTCNDDADHSDKKGVGLSCVMEIKQFYASVDAAWNKLDESKSNLGLAQSDSVTTQEALEKSKEILEKLKTEKRQKIIDNLKDMPCVPVTA